MAIFKIEKQSGFSSVQDNFEGTLVWRVKPSKRTIFVNDVPIFDDYQFKYYENRKVRLKFPTCLFCVGYVKSEIRRFPKNDVTITPYATRIVFVLDELAADSKIYLPPMSNISTCSKVCLGREFNFDNYIQCKNQITDAFFNSAFTDDLQEALICYKNNKKKVNWTSWHNNSLDPNWSWQAEDLLPLDVRYLLQKTVKQLIFNDFSIMDQDRYEISLINDLEEKRISAVEAYTTDLIYKELSK